MAKDKETGLTDKQKLFCHEYIIDLNATQACIRAGYSVNVASVQGSENLAKPNIQNYISELKEVRSKRCEITQDNVLKELAKIAFIEIDQFYNVNGQLKLPHELSDQAKASLSGIDIDEIWGYNPDTETREKIGETKKVKLHNKITSLELLGRHLGIFEKDNKQKSLDAAIIDWGNSTKASLPTAKTKE